MHESKLCSLHELRTIYTLTDLLDFCEYIDILEASKDSAKEKAELKAKRERENKGRK